jgi:putative serine protease PepD
MRAFTAVLACPLAFGLGVVACSAAQETAESPTSPAAADSPSTLEPSQTPEEQAGPEQSVVWVETEQAAGAGVVVTTDGYVLASANVVGSTDGDSLRVVLPGGDTTEAELVGSDPVSNLAVVRAESGGALIPAEFGGSGAVEVDDEVRLIGGPVGSGSPTVGFVRATDRIIDGSSVIEIGFDTTASVTGGPLVNGDDEVVGFLMTFGTTSSGDNELEIGYAVPSDVASQIATDLIETGQVSRPHLGVQVGDADGGGALVREVIAGSPADQAGLRADDVINRLGDDPIDGSEALVSAVRSSQIGDELPLTFARDGTEQRVTVVLGEAPSE